MKVLSGIPVKEVTIAAGHIVIAERDESAVLCHNMYAAVLNTVLLV